LNNTVSSSFIFYGGLSEQPLPAITEFSIQLSGDFTRRSDIAQLHHTFNELLKPQELTGF
jgi:hypothetical protein